MEKSKYFEQTGKYYLDRFSCDCTFIGGGYDLYYLNQLVIDARSMASGEEAAELGNEAICRAAYQKLLMEEDVDCNGARLSAILSPAYPSDINEVNAFTYALSNFGRVSCKEHDCEWPDPVFRWEFDEHPVVNSTEDLLAWFDKVESDRRGWIFLEILTSRGGVYVLAHQDFHGWIY